MGHMEDKTKRTINKSYIRVCLYIDSSSYNKRITQARAFTANFALKFPVHVYNVDTNLIKKGNRIETTHVSNSAAHIFKFDLVDNPGSLQTPVASVAGGKSSSTFTSRKNDDFIQQ